MADKLIRGEDFYLDENGLFVFTEKYLLNRGYCCKNGCRHCPYGYKRSTEPFNFKLSQKKEPDNKVD